MCDRVVSKNPSLIVYCPDKYKSQRKFDSVASEDPSFIAYCPEKYKTQRMCNETVDDCLAALKLVRDCFLIMK